MRQILHVLTVILAVAMLSPRGLADAQSPDKKTPALKKPSQASQPASEGWEAEWQKTLAAGKKEGRVSVYVTSLAPAMTKHVPLFKKQFGIEIEVTSGRGPEMLQRLRTEKNAGLNLVDVLIAGGEPVVSFKVIGITESLDSKLILPEVTDPRLWYTLDHLPWLDDDRHLLSFYAYPNRDIVINTDLIKPAEIQSWQDLLKPQYKGKMVWSDPSIDGSGFSGFSTNLMNKVTDENYYRKLVATQDIALSRDQRLMAEWVARGKYAVSVSAGGGATAQMFDAGAHIAYVRVREGTYLSYDAGTVGVAAKAPHPNAAKVFVNWLLSREGQEFAQRATHYMSARNDIPTKGIVHPETMRVPGEKYYVACNTSVKCILEEQGKYFELAKEIFGPLIGR